MIWLSESDRKLLTSMEAEISKEIMLENWNRFMEFTPIPSGSPQEVEAMHFLKEKLEEYGLKPEILYYDAFISEPKWAKLEIHKPYEFEVKCTPYRQVGTTGPEGIEGEVIYIGPEDIGLTECNDKFVLCEQKTTADWMGLRNGLLLKLEKMGVKGLIVIEQDSFMPTVVHQRADFSVSGNPTSDNIHLVHRIPAIVHVSYKDGQHLKKIVKQGNVRAHVTSIVDTQWKKLPLLVAEIKGRKDPNKFILVNSHIDTPPFSPGVVDNVSGDIAILELARIINNHNDKLGRSVRFAFWTGHEIGRYAGSTWYNDAFWHDLHYNCVSSYNIDSPGTIGATEFRAAPISEVQDAAIDCIKSVTGKEVKNFRWPTRAGDGSFWSTGIPHVSITSSRPKELYDPYVNYSGGGWWWHTPYATMDRGDVDVLAIDVKVELNYIFRMTNCPVLPMSFSPYAKHMLSVLKELQEKADKIKDYFNIHPIIEKAEEFVKTSEAFEETVQLTIETGVPNEILELLNNCLMLVSRYINPIAHSNAGPTEQMSMETFGATPFPRIYEILKLSEMTLHNTPEFQFLRTKLHRQRNVVEDGFYLANELMKKTIEKVREKLTKK